MLDALKLWLVLATSMTAATAGTEPPSVTLDQLRSAPRQYAGQLVRLHGQVDQCWNMECSLCPLEATPQNPQWGRCLALDFDRMRGGNDNRGADMDGAFRYADVVLTARFDPACLVDVCLDRASVLLDARVEQVTRRRRSRDGLIRRPDRLTVAPAGVASAVAQLVRPAGAQPVVRPIAVFVPASDASATDSAIVCVSMVAPGGATEWPASWQGALVARSTEDSYRCWFALRESGQWRLRPN